MYRFLKINDELVKINDIKRISFSEKDIGLLGKKVGHKYYIHYYNGSPTAFTSEEFDSEEKGKNRKLMLETL